MELVQIMDISILTMAQLTFLSISLYSSINEEWTSVFYIESIVAYETKMIYPI